MEYIIENEVIKIITDNHLVYTPFVLTKSITDSMVIIEGPTILISPNGTKYPPISFSVVPKYSAILKFTLKNINPNSAINIRSSNTEDALVDSPSVLYTSYIVAGSNPIIIAIVLPFIIPINIPIAAIMESIVHIKVAFLVGLAILQMF